MSLESKCDDATMRPALFPQFGDVSSKPVNVSQVRQLSPFRYPGGKTWCVPEIKRWLQNSGRPRLFIEPFGGGAIAALTVASENLADHVLICELDRDVASVWHVTFGPSAANFNWLIERIKSFQMFRENVIEALSEQPQSLCHRAFLTILKNRVNRGGILAPGASFQKDGENGKGIGSRWYADTLVSRLRAIRELRRKVWFVHGDGLEVIRSHSSENRASYFIDPPYTAGGKKAGSRLYVHNTLDHSQLFQQMSEIKGLFLMTYDDAAEVRSLAGGHKFSVREVVMKSTHHVVNMELLISNATIE